MLSHANLLANIRAIGVAPGGESGELAERQEGRLQFRGPSATAGYFNNPEATKRLFDGDWLDSGDRAYIADGEVYLTGRIKDMIIRGGRNICPHEVEGAVGGVAGVRRGCVAVFGSADPATGTERLVVLAETREVISGEATDEVVLQTLRQRIVEATVAALGEPPDEVVLASPHSVLKTSSGKIWRAAWAINHRLGRLLAPDGHPAARQRAGKPAADPVHAGRQSRQLSRWTGADGGVADAL